MHIYKFGATFCLFVCVYIGMVIKINESRRLQVWRRLGGWFCGGMNAAERDGSRGPRRAQRGRSGRNPFRFFVLEIITA